VSARKWADLPKVSQRGIGYWKAHKELIVIIAFYLMMQGDIMPIRPAFLSFVLLLTACLGTPQPSDSGIEGIVTIGPMCPVMQENVPCPDQPYQATLTVLTTSGKKVTQFQTDEKGHFRVNLSPGDYILHPKSPNVMPSAADMPFTVNAHKYALLKISYDSGIR
jgi:hypothetical protein